MKTGIHVMSPGPNHRVLTTVASAAHAFNAGLVDECQLFVYPVLVGEGKPAFPSDARIQLELLEERRFGNGVVNLRYRIQS